jgi:hypothetical protein
LQKFLQKMHFFHEKGQKCPKNGQMLPIKVRVQQATASRKIFKDFEKNERIEIDNTRGLGIGFKWEEGIEYDSTKTDKIAQNALSTWIANQFTDPNEKPIKITLTISLEQTA